MKKFIAVIAMLLLFSSCSVLPRITFGKAGVTPTQTEKKSKVVKCSGTWAISEDGTTMACSSGFYSNEENFSQKERAYTLAERVGNFIRGLAGVGFWGLVLAVILFPGLAGWLIGRVYNVFNKGLVATVGAITKFREKIPTVTLAGVEVPDPVYMKAVDTLLDELTTAHSQDAKVLKTILDIRTKLKIDDMP